jgi:hypoxanthine phosphoribosyltransferase
MTFMPTELSHVLFSEETLKKRVIEMANQLNGDYAGDELVVLCVLKGSIMFVTDLIKHLNIRVAVDFIGTSSYGSSSKTSGVVKMVKDLEESIQGRHVLVVDDIVDSGLTLDYLRRLLLMREPKSLKTCALLSKMARRSADLRADYVGFEIDDHFVVGYGLDYLSLYRNLPYIGVLDPSRIENGGELKPVSPA